MVCITKIQPGQEYICDTALNVYKTPTGDGLVTQAQTGRQLRVTQRHEAANLVALKICLCEDDYPGWITENSVASLSLASVPYVPPYPSAEEIAAHIPAVIQFTQMAMNRPNTYLWGGTIGPDFDCSGLVQTAFASVGVMLPRDSYQQKQFVQTIDLKELKSGDLLFFGKQNRTTHVALYLEDGKYIHSSGKDHGRNGIGIDSIVELSDSVSQFYFQQLLGAGRVIQSYQPTGQPLLCHS